ncbi:hypothetical protein GGI24_005726 [Coemansia furcata]|nr:hypothetical protein GGI24_005726 [Coemansia furcata]
MSGPGSIEPTNPFYNMLAHNNDSSQTSSSGDFEYVWAPPTPDPGYWDNVARARDIRHSVARMKMQLAQATHEDDVRRLSDGIRASERRLMKYVDRYILSYDDVVESSRVLGTVSPPTSPGLAPNRPLPPTPTPHFVSGALPPTPPAAAAAIAALGSQAFINSYKRGPDCLLPAGEEPPESNTVARKPAWVNLFGSRSVRLADNAPPADRVGLPSPVSPRQLHAA